MFLYWLCLVSYIIFIAHFTNNAIKIMTCFSKKTDSTTGATVVSLVSGKHWILCHPLTYRIRTASEMKVIVFLLLLYCTLFSFDQIKMISLFLPLFRVINCVLFVYPSMVYYYIFIWIILYSFWLVCCCSNELIPECFFFP